MQHDFYRGMFLLVAAVEMILLGKDQPPLYIQKDSSGESQGTWVLREFSKED